MDINQSCAQSNWIEKIQPAYTDQLPNYMDENGDLICGIYTGMDNETYHSLDAYNSSLIKKMISKTPAHVRAELDNKKKNGEFIEQNRALELGTLAHELILEPERFNEKYFKLADISEHPDALVTVKELTDKCEKHDLSKSGSKQELIERISQYDHTVEIWDLIIARSLVDGAGRRAFEIAQQLVSDKKVKNIAKAFETAVVKRYCIKQPIEAKLWADTFKVKSAYLKHSRASLLISDGFAEIAMIARDPMTGLLLKIKVDYLRRDAISLDIKTARSADPTMFSRQCRDLNYDAQAEFYKYVANLLNVPVEIFAFVAIEYEEVEICELFELTKARQEKAWRNTERALRTLKECLDTDNWYGYTANGQVIVID